MKTKILNGTSYQNTVFNQIKNEIEKLKSTNVQTPGITFVACVGHQPLMKYTIGLHKQAAEQLGFNVNTEVLPHTAKESDLLEVMDKLNRNKNVHAIVLLQPVPKHLNALSILERIDPDKEIEGFHPLNIKETLVKGIYNTKYPMCLPLALFELFKIEGVTVKSGQEFVFVVDQDFLSDPFRSLILRTASAQVVPPDCALTLVSSDHSSLINYCKTADFIVVVSEKPEFFEIKRLKPNVCIIDIYSNLVDEVASKYNSKKLVPVIKGGVNTKEVIDNVGAIAPCPGGLMPVLLAVLFRNALHAFKNTLSNEIMSKRKQQNPFSLIKNYELIKSEFALLKGLQIT